MLNHAGTRAPGCEDKYCTSCNMTPKKLTENDVCEQSKRPCGHHCNHCWSHDECCWCGREWGEIVLSEVG